MTYLLDANAFIESFKRYYAFDICPGYWDWLDAKTADGTVLSIDKVRDELLARSDDLSAWAQQRTSLFTTADPQTLTSLQQVSAWAAQEAATGRYNAAAVNAFLQEADYYLVAQAHARQLTVVTLEIPGTRRSEIKIPDACIGMGVEWVAPFEMLRREKAIFVLR